MALAPGMKLAPVMRVSTERGLGPGGAKGRLGLRDQGSKRVAGEGGRCGEEIHQSSIREILSRENCLLLTIQNQVGTMHIPHDRALPPACRVAPKKVFSFAKTAAKPGQIYSVLPIGNGS